MQACEAFHALMPILPTVNDKLYTMIFPVTAVRQGILGSLLFITFPCFAQKQTVIIPNLPEWVQQKKITAVNRNVSVRYTKDQKIALHLDEKPGPGMVWLNGIGFSNGTIAFDVKGKNLPGRSFVGIAFHRKGAGYDAVYFRPFNFRAPAALKKSHAVQYISYPGHEWHVLRQAHPGEYENAIVPAPDPEAWFHVRIVVGNPVISVYVNGDKKPCLRVNKLDDRKEGGLGFWVGNGSGGDFANLKITGD
jgi:hypothetical protein